MEVVTHGDLPEPTREYARTKIVGLAEHLSEPVLHARIRLTRQANPAVPRPVRAQANLDVNGRPVRAEMAGATSFEAVDLLVDRLRRRLLRRKQHWEARRGAQPTAEPHEWRHGDEPTHRPPYHPRPVEERRVIRHKSYSPPRIGPDEAAWEMDQLDYEFHLFTEAATGADAVIYRAGPTGYRLARSGPAPGELVPAEVPITLSPQPAPELSLAQAQQRLVETGLPFVFFTNPETGRGRVLYHRYDGHYGLITPAQ